MEDLEKNKKIMIMNELAEYMDLDTPIPTADFWGKLDQIKVIFGFDYDQLNNVGEILDRRVMLQVSTPVERNGKIKPRDFCNKWIEIESEQSRKCKNFQTKFQVINRKEAQIVSLIN